VSENNSQLLYESTPPTTIETQDHLEFPAEALPPRGRRPVLLRHPEPEPEIWRGIFTPTYKWKALFSQQVEIRTAELPRLKPHITIDRRTLEGEDD